MNKITTSGTHKRNGTGRKPRFRRVAVPNIRLTERDIGIIHAVHAHRFLTSSQIVMLFEGSKQQIVRRLQPLYHHQYLDRPREQREYQARNGVQRMVYGLGNKGADLLLERYGIPRGKVDWTSKNRETGQVHIEHTLQTAEAMVRLESACREAENIRLIKMEEIMERASESMRLRGTPPQWDVTVTQKGMTKTFGITPDNFFGLEYRDRPEGKNRKYFFLETDRGTEPVRRSNLSQSSIRRKFITYFETNRQGCHSRDFNIKHFRVLFVTTTAERTGNFIETNKMFHRGIGSAIFLFTDIATVTSSENILTQSLCTGEGEHVTLLG